MPDYAVLALGDREYPEFCSFGHAIDRWAHSGGGRRLFDLVEMDGEDIDAQRQWQQQIVSLGADADQPDWAPAEFFPWTLVERRCLNPGSQGAPAYHLSLRPTDGVLPHWRAGDLAEIAPRHDPARVAEWLKAADLDGSSVMDGRSLADHLACAILPEVADLNDRAPSAIVAALRPLPHREYSLASIPEDGRVDLLVRQMQRPDGGQGLGYGSGWLTVHAEVGGEVRVRLRDNVGFHAPESPVPMILIGNGTGLAGLRAHLRQRAQDGVTGAWLMFGERSAAHDAFYADEMETYLASGVLERVDVAWSRDGGESRYVQHLLAKHAQMVRDRIEEGAVVLVCGSLQGMAAEVDATLRQLLGDSTLEGFADEGRYRRDIY